MLRKYLLLRDPAPPNDGGANQPPPTPSPEPTPAPEPAPPAPEPEPPEPDDPPPQPTPEELAAKETSDALLKTILGDLKPTEEPAPEPEPTPAPEPEPTPAPAPTPPPEPAPAPAPQKRAKKSIAPAVVPPPIPDDPPQPAPAKPQPPAEPDAEYIASLSEEQREELREMEVAERMFPERYKGKRKELLEFFKTYDKRAPEIAATTDNLDDNPDFKRLIDMKPKMTALDAKRVNRTIGQEEAAAKVEERIKPEIEVNKLKLRELEVRPEVVARVNQLDKQVNAMFVADPKSPLHEVSKLFAEKGPEVAKDPNFALEVTAAKHEMGFSKHLMHEYEMFQRGARKFDDTNPIHRALFEFIENEGNALQQAGGLVRGGKRFLTRTQYVQQQRAHGDEATAAKYFTFSDDDIRSLIVEDTKIRIEARVNKMLKENEKLGFVRKSKENAPPRNEPTPLTPPKATPSKAPGPSPAPQPTAADAGINVISTLYKKP